MRQCGRTREQLLLLCHWESNVLHSWYKDDRIDRPCFCSRLLKRIRYPQWKVRPPVSDCLKNKKIKPQR